MQQARSWQQLCGTCDPNTFFESLFAVDPGMAGRSIGEVAEWLEQKKKEA